MRVTLITLFSLLIALVPICVFGTFSYFLEEISSFLGIPSVISYFLFGYLIGVNKKVIIKKYRRWWRDVWEAAGEKI